LEPCSREGSIDTAGGAILSVVGAIVIAATRQSPYFLFGWIGATMIAMLAIVFATDGD
jgi:hypothetical protein